MTRGQSRFVSRCLGILLIVAGVGVHVFGSRFGIWDPWHLLSALTLPDHSDLGRAGFLLISMWFLLAITISLGAGLFLCWRACVSSLGRGILATLFALLIVSDLLVLGTESPIFGAFVVFHAFFFASAILVIPSSPTPE